MAGHSRTVLSVLPVTSNLPLGVKTTVSTEFTWPVSGVPSSVPVATSHSPTVVSVLPEANV